MAVMAALWASPVLAGTQEELEQTQKAIEQAEAKQEKLAAQTEKLEAELKKLQENLVSLADSIQKGEASLSDSEEKLRILNEQLKEKNTALKRHQKNLEALVQAALSMSYTPAEAMIMMPTNAMDSMKTARALKMASDDIRRETLSIARQLTELKALEQTVKRNHDALLEKQAGLAKERKNMATRLSERTELLKKLGQERSDEADKMAKLAKKAEDLKSLVSSIEKEDGRRKSTKRTSHSAIRELRSFDDAKGRIKAPVSGKLVQSFGVSQGKNATSKGVLVSTRASARVTSPYDGEVVFTGPFMTYGQMVIIRHSDDFHTLLAGLVKIDVEVGQFLLEGEPIGAMGDSESGNRLYIELRQNNQPVNPALWIKGLNKKN